MHEMDRARLVAQLVDAFEQAEARATTGTFKGRPFRVRTVTVTVAEVRAPDGSWVPLGRLLTGHLLGKVASGEATPDSSEVMR